MVINKEKKSKSVYGPGPGEQSIERHTLTVLVDNEPGVLARVIGLFSGRGYNIESLTVAEVSKKLNQSRMTIVVVGTPAVIDQVRNQLERLVPVHNVKDLTEEGAHVERDLVLIKVVGTGELREKTEKIANDFGANIVDNTDESFIFELVDSPEKIDDFIEILMPLGLVNISRTGSAAISRGKEQM